MDDSPDTASTGFEVTLDDQGTPTLHLEGRMDSGSAPAMINGVISLFTKNPPATLIVDLAKVTYLDDFGALVLVELKNLMPGKENRMVIANAADTVKDVLAILNFDAPGTSAARPPKRSPNMFTRLGSAVFRQASELKFVFSFIGSVCFALFYVLLQYTISLKKYLLY